MKIFYAVFFILAIAAAAFFTFGRMSALDAPPAMPQGHLAAAIPAAPAGWKSTEMALGETEEVERSAEKILNNTDFLNRRYESKDGLEFGLYISYWGPGKTTPRSASSHTPDWCWTRNGWKVDPDKSLAEFYPGAGSVPLTSAYYREYDYDAGGGRSIHRRVAFWCIVGDEKYSYSEKSSQIPNLFSWLYSALKYNKGNLPHIYFIRVDSSDSFDVLKQDKGFNEVMDAVGRLAAGKDKIKGWAN